jgi:hypothetical protein
LFTLLLEIRSQWPGGAGDRVQSSF